MHSLRKKMMVYNYNTIKIFKRGMFSSTLKFTKNTALKKYNHSFSFIGFFTGKSTNEEVKNLKKYTQYHKTAKKLHHGVFEAFCDNNCLAPNDMLTCMKQNINCNNKKITKLKGIFSHHAGPSWQYHPKEPSVINVPNYPYIRLPRGNLFFLNKYDMNNILQNNILLV